MTQPTSRWRLLLARWLVPLIVLLLLLAAPLVLSGFRLNLLGKFVTFAIAALALDLIWGYAGLMSLGQGVFFGLGAYAMAMYLKLESSGGKLPDFMSWSGLTALPWFWEPFRWPWFRTTQARFRDFAGCFHPIVAQLLPPLPSASACTLCFNTTWTAWWR